MYGTAPGLPPVFIEHCTVRVLGVTGEHGVDELPALAGCLSV